MQCATILCVADSRKSISLILDWCASNVLKGCLRKWITECICIIWRDLVTYFICVIPKAKYLHLKFSTFPKYYMLNVLVINERASVG